jgi:hypothetical protein
MRSLRSTLTMLVAAGLMVVPTVPVLAQSPSAAAAAAVPFTGRITFGDCTTDSVTDVDGVVQNRGITCTPVDNQMSDARLLGTVTVRANQDVYPDGTMISEYAYRIENAAGAWQGEPALKLWYPNGTTSTVTVSLVGEGAYEGLIAVAEVPVVNDAWDFNGVIINGRPPVDP